MPPYRCRTRTRQTRRQTKAIAFLKSFYPKPNGRNGTQAPSPPIGEYLPDDELAPNYELAEIVTRGDRQRPDYRLLPPRCHARHLRRLQALPPCRMRQGTAPPWISTTPLRGHQRRVRPDHDDRINSERIENQTRHNAKQYNDDADPFDFDNYGRDGLHTRQDGTQGRNSSSSAAKKPWKSPSTPSANSARVLRRRHIPDRDYTPIENPEDDPYGKGCYGYKVLRLGFNEQPGRQSRQQGRRGIQDAKMAQHPPVGRWQSCRPGGHGVSRSPYPQTAPERSRHQPGRSPKRPPSKTRTLPRLITPERAPRPPCRGWFQTSPRTHAPLNRASFSSSDPERSEGPPAPKPPPRKKPPNTYLGSPADDPPADGPRERRDPGDIRIPLRNLLSVSVSPL